MESGRNGFWNQGIRCREGFLGRIGVLFSFLNGKNASKISDNTCQKFFKN
jgi:hypothetical protein